MDPTYLLVSIVKIVAVVAYVYGLLWVMGRSKWWAKLLGIVVMFGIVQLALTNFGKFQLLNDFDKGLLFQACTYSMISLGLNLIYGFNGQFSLGQWGFYGIGAYVAADITFRWVGGDPSGLIVVGFGVALAASAIWGIRNMLGRLRSVPVMSAFTIYLIGICIAAVAAIGVSHFLSPLLAPLIKTAAGKGPLASGFPLQVVFFLSVLLAGAFAAEVSFIFGIPVLTLGSDYFGIATLGFTIVVNVLMVNSDTILPFPEMKGGRGMIGIPKLTTWFWAFFFLVLVIIVMRNIIRSTTGRTILSVREDETAAKAMGIDVAETKLLAFVVGSLFAGIGGAVYAHYIGFLSPGTFDFLAGFNPLIIIVFGGLGSMTGTIVASFGWMFFLEGLLRVLLGQMGTEAPTWRFVLYPLTLLLLMLIRPSGLLGTSEWGFLKEKIYQARTRETKEAVSLPEQSQVG